MSGELLQGQAHSAACGGFRRVLRRAARDRPAAAFALDGDIAFGHRLERQQRDAVIALYFADP
jgi:hypothetical protein